MTASAEAPGASRRMGVTRSMASAPTDLDAAFVARRHAMAQKLLPAMERMLDEETVTEISVERLIGEAKATDPAAPSRSSFYNHFEDKGDLLALMIEGVMAGLLDTARAWWEIDPADVTPDGLLEALRPIFDTYEPHQKLMMAVVDAASYDRRVAAMYDGLMEGAARRVEAHIRDGQRRGFVSAAVDPVHDAIWITWMMERGLQQLVAPASPRQRGRLLVALRDIVWRSLYEEAT